MTTQHNMPPMSRKARPISLEDDVLDASHGPTRLLLLAEYWKSEAVKARSALSAARQPVEAEPVAEVGVGPVAKFVHWLPASANMAHGTHRLYLAAQQPATVDRDAVIEEVARLWDSDKGESWIAKAIRALKGQPATPPAGEARDGFYLASFKRGNGFVTWWGPNNAGYTPYLEQAGVYGVEDIKKGYHDSEQTVPVPVSFARQFACSVIDTGHSGRNIFWNAEALRAALSQQERKEGGGNNGN